MMHITRDKINNAISFTDTLGNSIPFNLNYPDDATLEVVSARDLQTDKDYLININLAQFQDASGNFSDTTIVYRIRTISGLEFTGVSGNS